MQIKLNGWKWSYFFFARRRLNETTVILLFQMQFISIRFRFAVIEKHWIQIQAIGLRRGLNVNEMFWFKSLFVCR